MYVASPHETGPLAEHLSIDLYVAALGDPNMRMFVMSKDPVMLEDVYNHTKYEALLLGTTELTQPAVLDPASYMYNDKGRKKRTSGQWRYTRMPRSTISRRGWPSNRHNWTRGRCGATSLHDPKTPNPRQRNTIGGRPDMPAAEATRPIPDPTRTPPEGDQAADAAPITIATRRKTRIITRTCLPVTTAAVRDT